MSQLPPAPPPTRPPRPAHRMEIVLVALAVAAGLAVTAAAAATEPEGGGTARSTGSALDDVLDPSTELPDLPELTGPMGATGGSTGPVGDQPVTLVFSEWRFVPSGPGTCRGTLSIEWGIESTGPLPIGDRVVIQVTGPGISRTYREPLTEQGVSIVVDVPSSNTGRVVAVPESVGGRDVDGFVRVVAEDFC